MTNQPAPPPNHKTHCPCCHRPEIRYAHNHCPRLPDGTTRCTWYTCQCGTTWDTLTGHWTPPLNGTGKDTP